MLEYIEKDGLKPMTEQTEPLLYHVTDVGNLPSISRDGLRARAGSWLHVAWRPRVFFTTTRMGAYELANTFMWERKGVYLIIRVDASKIRGKIHPDRDYDQGVWTATDVPPEAIIGVDDVDEDFFESHEFLAYMGCEEDDDLAPSA